MSVARNKVIDAIWRGIDPFIGFPQGLYEYDPQGWHSDHPYLTASIEQLGNAPVIVEVGAWKGASVITMANHLRILGRDGVVIAVDTWLGSWEHWIRDELFTQLSISHGRPSLQYKFMSNIIRTNLEDFVIPFPLDSISAVNVMSEIGVAPDLIHIDAGHDYHAVLSDLEHWWPLLSVGGFLIGDDYNDPNWSSVTRAFDDFFGGMQDIRFEHTQSKCRIEKLSEAASKHRQGDIHARQSCNITGDFLADKVFSLVRVDNEEVLAQTVVFAANGRLDGYQMGRHWSWMINDGNLTFLNNHSEVTDIFDRWEVKGKVISLVGHLSTLHDDYWIRLVEQVQFDPANLAAFRDDKAAGNAARQTVAVMVRTHRADAKFDELMSKLNRDRDGFDLYALVDVTSGPISAPYSGAIYFDAEACHAIGLARPHPTLFHQYGDVAMSYGYRQIPSYEFYIMIDDDVDLIDDDASLFNDIVRAVSENSQQVDFLGLLLGYRPLTTHGFYLLNLVPESLLRYCYFPFVGLSSRAAAFMFTQRQLEFARGNVPRDRPMCEIFVPSLLHAAGFDCRDLAEVLPGAYSAEGMMLQAGDPGCGRPMGFDRSDLPAGRMIHPVYTQQDFVARLRRQYSVDNASTQRKFMEILDGPIGAGIPQELRSALTLSPHQLAT